MSNGATVRQNVDSLSADDLAAIRTGYAQMQAINDNRGYNYLAGYHGVPGFYCYHHHPLFLPWHRAYLYTFEQFLRDQQANTAIPWWDWTSDISHQNGVPQAFSDATDADGNANPLLKSHISVASANPPLDRDTVRQPGSPGDLPAASALQDLLTRTDFLDFQSTLETQFHDFIHGWTGGLQGDMGVVPTAAYDPIFFSHHCMVDRIWYLWQVQNGQNNIPNNLLDQSLEPFGMTVSGVLDISQLGYDYAVGSVSG